MPLTEPQRRALEELFQAENTRRFATGGTPLVDFASLSAAQQRAFLVGLIQAQKTEKNRQLQSRAVDQAAETARITAERDALQALEDNL
jgi:hypothetical protein